MTYTEAKDKAKRVANETGSSVLVYASTVMPRNHGIAFTLPNFSVRIGDRIYPDGTTFIDITDTMVYFPS